MDGGYSPPGPRERLARSVRRDGAAATARRAFGWAFRFAAGPAAGRRMRGEATFMLAGERLAYEDAWHKWTWLNERAVEVPVAARAAAAADPARTLEVGNVLSHYRAVRHAVVDKYERAPGVRNVDIFDLPGSERYDLVLSVSTLEHVGWDEPARDPQRALDAALRLQQLVTPGGRLLVTVPVGYHPRLHAALLGGELGFRDVRALRCLMPSMRWREVDPGGVAAARYDDLIYRAEAVLVATWEAPPSP